MFLLLIFTDISAHITSIPLPHQNIKYQRPMLRAILDPDRTISGGELEVSVSGVQVIGHTHIKDGLG